MSVCVFVTMSALGNRRVVPEIRSIAQCAFIYYVDRVSHTRITGILNAFTAYIYRLSIALDPLHIVY